MEASGLSETLFRFCCTIPAQRLQCSFFFKKMSLDRCTLAEREVVRTGWCGCGVGLGIGWSGGETLLTESG